jgi:ABC-2 type transport system ATP-binding protein
MNAIETKDLVKTYRGKKGARVEALKGVNLVVERGEVFGFLGPNGAGKSTTIKTLMGLLSPSGGSARIMGIVVQSHLARRQVGYLPENPAFYDYLSAEEYLAFVGGSFGMEPGRLKERSEAVLRRLDLWEPRRRQMRGYSKGMVQRLGIAQTLLHEPELYILDEPMSGLDPVGRAEVKTLITELKQQGKSVFFSTHVTSDVEEVCDRVGIIVNGELKRVERVDAILSGGVEGYEVRYLPGEGAEELRQLVAARELAATLASLEGRGARLLLVEPCRKNLEEFFLATVKGA